MVTPVGRLTPRETATGASVVFLATRPALLPTATVDGVMVSPAATGVLAAGPGDADHGATASRPNARR
jgi:hypothetical protein